LLRREYAALVQGVVRYVIMRLGLDIVSWSQHCRTHRPHPV